MSKGRLTRHELSWLLTQEAQNAAERLRVGVQSLRTQTAPPDVAEDHGVETSLDALDDVMRMLSRLNQRSSTPSGSVAVARRGRIDVAALLVEIAPDARVSIEPGSGTEVYGDEADLRRLFQVLIGPGEGATITVRREADDVRVVVSLGPDSSKAAETERAWLARMALRYGGRYELEGGSEVLVLPADGANERSESEALRKELAEARKQGEVYARELAAVFDRGEDLKAISTIPPAGNVSIEARLIGVTKLCAGIASELAHALDPAKSELLSMRRHEVTDDQLDTLRRRLAHASDVVKGLAAIGALRAGELPTEVELGDLARGAVKALAATAERDGVQVDVRVDVPDGRVHVRRGQKALAVVVRELVAHAIEASPRGGVVVVTVHGAEGTSAGRIVVDDSGAPLPASGRRAFLALETHAGAYGRPSGLPVFLAAELAACQGATLELTDVPVQSSEGASGLRVVVSFAKG